MNKTKITYFIDIVMAFLLIVVTISSVALYLLPSGVRRGGWQLFLGITKKGWMSIHSWSGWLLIVLMIIHFLMHWKWVKEMTKNFFKK